MANDLMKKILEEYIEACDANIAKYSLMEDGDSKERALKAAESMKAGFVESLKELG